MMEFFIPKLFTYLFSTSSKDDEDRLIGPMKPVVPICKNWLYRQFLVLFESLLLHDETRDSLNKRNQELKDREEAKRAFQHLQIGLAATDVAPNVAIKVSSANSHEKEVQMVTEIRSLFVMALAWSFGAALTGQGRTFLSSWISDLFS